jgi:hypothetical protein
MAQRTRNKIAQGAHPALRLLPIRPQALSAQDLDPRVEES